MLGNILKKILKVGNKKGKGEGGSFVRAQLNDRIMPIYRGYYEDRLHDYLVLNNYGEVTGGGTAMSDNTEIAWCDLEILLYKVSDMHAIIGEIIKKLEEIGAPKGSKIIVEETGEEIDFGKTEGIAIYLDGVNLPEEVYKECDSNFVLSELSRLIGYTGEEVRYWQGKTETGFYFYGDSFDRMNNAISDFVNTYPLCKGAIIRKIA